MIFKNADGRVIQENTHTEDRQIAILLLAERAMLAARAKVIRLEALFSDAQKAGFAPTAAGWQRTETRNESGTGPERRARRRPVRDDSAHMPKSKGAKTGAKR